ncbi:hypothetical protein COCC4DRAFT_29957 [Bipolaris maydis ATCC 48331]|uniref:Uncharacterized protein n=2 Tax=Cochliobolus heterostrophus TaxID=5016 RepID=M2UNP3_COCH5|nr:uncharacterized protein COCC4DRAFT_29957 [Bipolaris maydis ATCC 48331]EMD89542.1 hypothetical protein COCHEDRAFT_1021885 [Bipolaris maydis C5]ENI10245.1 hypothetical protein COCC4DRAFT_29957 [Bipolaris maydis ATCC 48331]
MAIVHPTDNSHLTAAKPKDSYCCIAAPPYLWKIRAYNLGKGGGTEGMMSLAECTTDISGHARYKWYSLYSAGTTV